MAQPARLGLRPGPLGLVQRSGRLPLRCLDRSTVLVSASPRQYHASRECEASGNVAAGPGPSSASLAAYQALGRARGAAYRPLLPLRRAGRTTCAATSSPSDPWLPPNPVELVKREAGLQSNRLPEELRDSVEAAIERLGGRVTAGDVSARAGVKLREADDALKALAYDTQASLKVSAEGDVVYGFAPDFRARLRNRSVVVRTAPLLKKLRGALAYLARVAFGTALIASVVVVWLAVLALLRGGRDDDRNGGRGGGGYYGGGGGVNVFMNVSDLFWYWDPYYYRNSARRVAEGSPLNFVESIFSFVFGDGDPNLDWEERRWQRLGEMIQAKGGVVTAEEVAPYLDPPEPAAPSADAPYPYPYPDESFVLPALIKFGGEAVVDEDSGALLYRFPSLQKTGVKQKRWGNRFSAQDDWEVPLERNWDFTAASAGQQAGTVLLGGLNGVGVALLSGLLADPRSAYVLAVQGLGWVAGLLPALQLYALAFFAIPAARWFVNASKNREIDARNDARVAAADLLNGSGAASGSGSAASAAARAAKAVDAKVLAARRLAEREVAALPVGAAAAADPSGLAEAMGLRSKKGRLGPRVVGDEDIVFDSGRDAEPQLNEAGLDEWDRRLQGRQAAQRPRSEEGGWGSGGGRGRR